MVFSFTLTVGQIQQININSCTSNSYEFSRITSQIFFQLEKNHWNLFAKKNTFSLTVCRKSCARSRIFPRHIQAIQDHCEPSSSFWEDANWRWRVTDIDNNEWNSKSWTRYHLTLYHKEKHWANTSAEGNLTLFASITVHFNFVTSRCSFCQETKDFCNFASLLEFRRKRVSHSGCDSCKDFWSA